MKKREPKSKPIPAKTAAPAIAAEAGREYREAAEQALANATPAEMRQLVIKLAIQADALTAKIWDRNAAARQLLTWCQIQDRGRRSYFEFIKSINNSIARVRELTLLMHFERREALIEVAATALAGLVAAGFHEVQLPDESMFPVREESRH